MESPSRPRSYVSEILTRLVQPEAGGFSPDVARAVLDLKLDESDRRRVQELSLRSSEGGLHREEIEEIDAYRRVGRLIELLQAKARRSLRDAGVAEVAGGHG